MLLSSVPWRVVVIDEAHRLKNRNCKLLEGLNNLQMVSKLYLGRCVQEDTIYEIFFSLCAAEKSQTV